MSLLPPILSIFVFIHLTLCWHKCTEFSVQQYLCNYTDTFSITNSECSASGLYPQSNCFYDDTQSLCICKSLYPCLKDDPRSNSYRLLQLNYSISLQLDKDNKQGIFSLSNLTTSYLQDVTTLLNSSLIPTEVNISYSTWCDGPMINIYNLFDVDQVLFNTTIHFTFDHNCDSFDFWNVLFFGQPIYNYYTEALYLLEYKGIYYTNVNHYINGYYSYGSMLVPETNSISNDYGNFTCLSFDSTPDPPTFQAYEYSDSYVSVSVSTYDLYTQVSVYSGVIGIEFYGAGIKNATSSIPPNITNYIHHYDHRLSLIDDNASFIFFHHIVLYNQNSYINETNYFTYDDSCITKTIYDNESLSYLTNEFCCVEWQIAGIVSTTIGPTTVSPTSSATTVSTTPNATTTVKTSQSTTIFTTSTVHPSQSTPTTNTCSSGWYQFRLASISIWILSVCALLFRSEKL